MAEASTKECDFCKEEIRADAIRCKHCGAAVGRPGPTHGGTCPYCKEEIKADAIKCKHCGSWVANTTHVAPERECGCGWTEPGSHARFGVPAHFGRRQTASPSMVQSARLMRRNVILGGPLDPGDQWYCDGQYFCTDLFGHFVCIWLCRIW